MWGFCKISQFFLFLLGGVIINRRSNICKINKVYNKNRKQWYLKDGTKRAAEVFCCGTYEEKRRNEEVFLLFFIKRRETFVLCCRFKKSAFLCDEIQRAWSPRGSGLNIGSVDKRYLRFGWCGAAELNGGASVRSEDFIDRKEVSWDTAAPSNRDEIISE